METTERSFDTNVQLLKYKVIKGVVEHFDKGTLESAYRDIPLAIAPGPKPTMRCCVYKERAIITERVRMAMGGDHENPNAIEVIRIACDECTVNRYHVGSACRGCIAHRCEHACPTGAISVHDGKAHIDQEKCVECGRCATACPYSAIMKYTRPCENACKIKAISMHRDNSAKIDNDKCIACGACVYQCPFGAIVDKSFVLDALTMMRDSENNAKYRVYAVVAPSISSQFSYAKTGQVVTGLKKLGFHSVVEAALGADMVAYDEAAELAEKGFLTSSCCPAFVAYVKSAFPDLANHISHNPSPMEAVARFIKRTDPTAKCIFVGPCTAKKMEFQQEACTGIDCVITFEELAAIFEAKGIDMETYEAEEPIHDATGAGRGYAVAGGVANAIEECINEYYPGTEVLIEHVEGLSECQKMLLMAKAGKKDGCLIEGMGCPGGCVAGAGTNIPVARGAQAVRKFVKDSTKSLPPKEYSEIELP